MEEHASIAAATAGPLAASPPAESAAPTSPRPEDLQSAASQLEALPCVPAVGTSLAAVIEPANNRSDVELVGSPPSRKRGRSSAPRELIVISSDSDSGGEDASLEALIQSRKARKFPRAGQSPAPYAVSAVDDGILEQLAQKRREKKQRRWLRKQARVAAAAPRGGQRSLSEEREPRPARTRPAPAWTPAGRHAHKQWARAVMPRRIHPMVCENGTVFPISLLNPSVDGVSHLIMLDLDNWPAFFLRLPQALNDDVLVCAFVGGHTTVKVPNDAMGILRHPAPLGHSAAAVHPASSAPSPPSSSSPTPSLSRPSASAAPPSSPFARLIALRRVMLTVCGATANASDFAMSLKCGQLHAQLPLHIPFTIFSGDHGLDEVCRHLPGRQCQRLDPHAEHEAGQMEQTQRLMCTLLNSITER